MEQLRRWLLGKNHHVPTATLAHLLPGVLSLVSKGGRRTSVSLVLFLEFWGKGLEQWVEIKLRVPGVRGKKKNQDPKKKSEVFGVTQSVTRQ
jgi:hypothetical protein